MKRVLVLLALAACSPQELADKANRIRARFMWPDSGYLAPVWLQ